MGGFFFLFGLVLWCFGFFFFNLRGRERKEIECI